MNYHWLLIFYAFSFSCPIIKGAMRGDIGQEFAATATDDTKETRDRTKLLYTRQITVQEFVQQGGDPNERDSQGRTILIHAARAGLTNLVDDLLKAGADPDLQDINGWTALMFAAIDKREGMINLLLNAGANPNIRNTNGKTAVELP